MMMMKKNLSTIVNLITLICVINIHQVVSKRNRESTLNHLTVSAWKKYMKNEKQPFAVVFDYVNTTVSRTQCQSSVQFITSMLYTPYAEELVAESYLTNETIVDVETTQILPAEPLQQNYSDPISTIPPTALNTVDEVGTSNTTTGTETRFLRHNRVEDNNNNLRRRRLVLRCTAAVCADSYRIILLKGCVSYCNARRRNLVETEDTQDHILDDNNDDKNTSNRNLQTIQELQIVNCLTTSCDYDTMVTNYKFQGWKSQLVNGRGSEVAKKFYEYSSLYAADECKQTLAEMTHFVVPLF
jgi:hypothetical protein